MINTIKKLFVEAARTYGYSIERRVDYGEYSLDLFDLCLSQLDPSREDFFFVQVGANDGVTGDPIHRYVKKHPWRGILLEPQPAAFRSLQQTYLGIDRLALCQQALAQEDGRTRFFTSPERDQLGTFNESYLRSKLGKRTKISSFDVETIRYETLLARHDVSKVDLLQVDAEGFDDIVIDCVLKSGCPLPALIRYEHLHLDSQRRNACVRNLSGAGYHLARDGRDTIALRQ